MLNFKKYDGLQATQMLSEPKLSQVNKGANAMS